MSKLKNSLKNRNTKAHNRAPYKVDDYKKYVGDPACSPVENDQDVCDPETKLPSIGSYISPTTTKEIVKYDGNPNGEFEMFMHESNFLAEIRELWKNGQMCDIALSVEKTTFRVHKIALAACSQHFRELFVSRESSSTSNHEITRIPLIGIKSDIVKKILDAIYNAKIVLNANTVNDILSASSYLRITSIVQACETYLTFLLNPENCLKTIQIAHMYNLEKLKESANNVACANFPVISKQKEFTKLRYFELLSMLPREDLAVNGSEIIVFKAVVRWMEADRSSRLPYVGRLLRHVRFPLMTENQLVDYVEGSQCIMEVKEAGELVREAVRYHLLPYRRSILQTQRTIPRTTYKAEVLVASGGLPRKGEGTTTDRVYYYAHEHNEWMPLTTLPQPRHHHAAAVLGGFLYIAGGDQGQGLSDSSKTVWRYDPWTEEWLHITDMLMARQSFQLGVLDSRLYAVGGRANKNETLSEVERYNPSTNAWSSVESISSPRRYVSLATLSGRLYAVGGSGNDIISRRVERYNPVSGKWERRHPICRPRFSASLHSIKNRLWLLGGATVYNSDPAKGVVGTNEIEVYSPALDQWAIVTKSNVKNFTSTADVSNSIDGNEEDNFSYEQQCEQTMDYCIRSARTESGTCRIGDKIYLVGGYSWKYRERINDVECVDISRVSPRFRGHYSKTKRDAEECTTRNIELIKNNDTKNFFDLEPCDIRSSIVEQLTDYPLHCTGIASASLTLYKKINFPPFREESKPLPILNSDQGNHVALPKREYKRTDGPVPKTAAAGFSSRNKKENLDEGTLESKIDTLRSIGFQETGIKPVTRPASTIPRLRKNLNMDRTTPLSISAPEDPIKLELIKNSENAISSDRIRTTARNHNDATKDLNSLFVVQELRLGQNPGVTAGRMHCMDSSESDDFRSASTFSESEREQFEESVFLTE